MIEWFDEMNLDPEAHPVAMGTRALGDRPWLVADDRRHDELAQKTALLETRRDEVLHLTEEARPAAVEVASLIGLDGGDGIHPLEHAARSVQEDLCLLVRRDDGWFLDASCVCFPTRWTLTEKVGRHIAEVHGPVRGYDPRITTRVDQLFDRLTERPVWRRNWFLMSDPALFRPGRPPEEVVIGAADVREQLYVRSERQTLRQVLDGWILFTIRIQQEPLGALLTDDDRIERFRTWVGDVSDDLGARRHLTDPQRAELLTALG